MNSPKINNIQHFEKSIANAIYSFLVVTFLITTILFTIIYYQTKEKQNSEKLKEIDTAISIFRSNLSEKLSIIASSNVFINFLTSGSATRKELEPLLLTELLPLKTNGITGFFLANIETGTNYQSGVASNQSVTLKLCYLAKKLDNSNGKCFGLLKLFFSEKEIVKNLVKNNTSIKPCTSCVNYNLTKNGYLDNFLVVSQDQFNASVTVEDQHDNILWYYLIIILILFVFSVFHKVKLRKKINDAISNPLDLLVKSIKNQTHLQTMPDALDEINYLSEQIQADRDQISKINEYEKNAAIGHLSASVAHDIRSPLAVMEILVSTISNTTPPDQSFIQSLKQAIQSVRDIANNLLEKYRKSNEDFYSTNWHIRQQKNQDDGNIARPVTLIYIIEAVISQKNHEWQNNPVEFQISMTNSAKLAWVGLAPNDIKRLISNLLNNSYEALSNKHIISISLAKVNNMLQLEIEDTGEGIPEDRIQNVLHGMSLKHAGKGMGLSSSVKYIKSLGGSLELTSKLKKGTKISILLPLISKPAWFPNKIILPEGVPIIILDDDISMHNLWKHRIKSTDLSSIYFVNSKTMLKWYDDNEDLRESAIYLIDYELRNDDFNGLEILKRIGAKKRAYLITSHAEELMIQKHTEQLGIFLIPKFLIKEIPIEIVHA